ncbi:MAG: hypothetical protein IPN67_20905 [Bacteroidales bacterium]|nr:hypothetical protein [Bacteroidales bacterium]
MTGRLLRDDGEDVGEYSINQGSLQLNTNYTGFQEQLLRSLPGL